MKQTYSVPSIPSIIDNLNSNTLSADATLSNAQKSAQRVLWFKESIVNNRLTDLLVALEQTIDSLPEGNKTVATVHPVTGASGVKKINYRDVAKHSFSTAYGHAVKANDKLKSTDLRWKLSRPEMTDKKEPATLEDKIARLLKESVDSTGLANVLQTIKEEQARHLAEVATLTSEHDAMLRKSSLMDDIAAIIRRGVTEEQAMVKAAMLNDITADELKVAIA